MIDYPNLISMAGLIMGIVGIKVHEILKVNLSWRVFAFIFLMVGEIVPDFILLFLSTAQMDTIVFFFFYSSFVGMACLVFMTLFDLRKTLNSNYWCFILSYFLAFYVVSLIFSIFVYLSPIYKVLY
ncbi:MAG: hypothetical protein QW633_00460 [Candidatus Aenigmatarchaeota archaeon]